jgi:hypothetical protein
LLTSARGRVAHHTLRLPADRLRRGDDRAPASVRSSEDDLAKLGEFYLEMIADVRRGRCGTRRGRHSRFSSFRSGCRWSHELDLLEAQHVVRRRHRDRLAGFGSAAGAAQHGGERSRFALLRDDRIVLDDEGLFDELRNMRLSRPSPLRSRMRRLRRRATAVECSHRRRCLGVSRSHPP